MTRNEYVYIKYIYIARLFFGFLKKNANKKRSGLSFPLNLSNYSMSITAELEAYSRTLYYVTTLDHVPAYSFHLFSS